MKDERKRQKTSRKGMRSYSKRKGVSDPDQSKGKKALSKSGELFRAIAEGARDAVIVVDSEGKVTYWNPASERILGYTSRQVTGKRFEVIVPKRYNKEYREALQFLKGEKGLPATGYMFESEAVKKDGTEIPVEVSFSTIEISGELHALCLVRDISDRRRTQKELRETLAKYQLAFDNQKDAVVLVDMETQQFVEVNRAAVNLYGYNKKEFSKMRITDIFSGTESRLDRNRQPDAEISIFEHKRKNGSIFPVEMTACVFMWKGRRTFCAIIKDLTGRECP